MKKLLIGNAGIPFNAKKLGTVEGIKAVRNLNLEAMELEFVHSVNISEEGSVKVKAAAEESEVVLTCHGQYYINMNAIEEKKLEASKERLYRAAHIANLCGARSVVFHPGFYMKMDKEECYKNVRKAIREVVERLKQSGNKIIISPETTGKHSQFGTLKEVIRLSQELDQVGLCLDYAHLRARENVNSAEQFRKVLEMVEKELGKDALSTIHIQFSGAKFTEKGEVSHLTLRDSDLNYKDMVMSWKEFDIKGVAISESPNLEEDALLVKSIYDGL